uniref:Uncharacterized protein n=1 Tax=Romanomermis culicivorax TaxID=13658 RepID=A0A915HRX6_ROMCU
MREIFNHFMRDEISALEKTFYEKKLIYPYRINKQRKIAFDNPEIRILALKICQVGMALFHVISPPNQMNSSHSHKKRMFLAALSKPIFQVFVQPAVPEILFNVRKYTCQNELRTDASLNWSRGNKA